MIRIDNITFQSASHVSESLGLQIETMSFHDVDIRTVDVKKVNRMLETSL